MQQVPSAVCLTMIETRLPGSMPSAALQLLSHRRRGQQADGRIRHSAPLHLQAPSALMTALRWCSLITSTLTAPAAPTLST